MLTPAELRQVIDDLPVVELKSVVLLRQRRTDPTLNIPQEQVVEATHQLITYTQSCQNLADVIRKMPPIPATDPALVEDFPL